ncbi:glycosyltransferase [Paludisphaera soli]|uniref:glycosyltransferase n=1 Tax=Paludisphaera soli TaxID=2712865 RepID=UPI0013EC2BC6|nr:glycosyltransferase family 4 protein [Paludisphaera soli]
MANGIAVLASDRGTLPETLDDGGFLPTPPEGFTGGLATPADREVAPWVATIERLWDDPAWEARHRELVLMEAGRWAPDAVAGRYQYFFGSIARPD